MKRTMVPYLRGVLSLVLLGFATVAAGDLSSGLVAYYPFNGNANDASGNGNNGTVNGATLAADRFGNPSSAYSFDGSSSYIEMARSLPDMESLSFSAWVFVPSLSAAGGYVFFEGDAVPGLDCGLSLRSGNSIFLTKNTSGETLNFPGSAIPINTWFHLVAVADAVGGVKQVWINGSKIAEANWNGRANVGNHYRLQIGRIWDGAWVNIERFAGKLDDLRFYNRALSAAEVQQLYGQAPALCDDFSTDTTANYTATYWPYSGASATPSIIYDASNQRAIVQGVGGYGNIVMEKNGESPISAGSDFTFSADVSILSEFNGYLYLGDNRPIPPKDGTGTGIRFNIGTYTAYNCDLETYQNGVSIADLRTTYTPQSPNHLKITRVNGVYSFYVNNNLLWTQAIPALDGMALYWGVGNEISSGPSGWTAQTAFDNICVTTPQTTGSDWPLRDKDLRGSRWAQGATCAVSLDAYSKRWEIAGAGSVLTGDVQGDSKLEVVTRTTTAIEIFDAAGNELCSIPFVGQGLWCLADVDGDGKKEILLGKSESDYSLSIYVFKGDGTELKKLSVQGSGQSDQSISPLFVADIDGDNQLEVVSAGNSGYAITWRGLEATSLSSGNRKWRVDVGPFTLNDVTRLGDLNGNGSLEIIQGSGGPCNGRVGQDGSWDCASYAWLFSASTGLTQWRHDYDYGGYYDASVFLPDLNGDGRPEIVTTTRRHDWSMGDYGVGTINILNPTDGATLNSINLGHYTEYGMFGNLDGNPGDEMVIMTYEGTTGYLRSYGDHLTPKGSYSRAGGWFRPMAICDLTGDGSPEILAVFSDASGASNDKLLILNSGLTQVLREIDLGEPNIWNVIASDIDGDGSVEIIAELTDKAVVLGGVGCSNDSDNDGVPDALDQCPDTPTGSIVNTDGCSIAQLVPCDGPASGGKWKSHGQYVRAVVATATDFLRAKLIARRQWMEIVTRAAWSKCGWNRRCDHDWDWNWHRNWDCDRDRDWGRGRCWDRD